VTFYFERIRTAPGFPHPERETGIVGHEYELGANHREFYGQSGSVRVEGVGTQSGVRELATDWLNLGNRVGYVVTTIVSPADQKAILTFGSDDGVKAWLNGKVVHAGNEIRGVVPDQEKVEVALKKGANSLMLKITQGDGGWGLCCGIKAADGGNIEGLRYKVE